MLSFRLPFILVVLTLLFTTACASKNPPVASLGAAPLLLEGSQMPGLGLVFEGQASWYGPYFNGRKTANGERFKMHELTAAHPSLPFGTLIEVTNLVNNTTVQVRVNDRGPFVKGRCMDLSMGAARALNMINQGVSPIKARIVSIGSQST